MLNERSSLFCMRVGSGGVDCCVAAIVQELHAQSLDRW